MLRHLVPFYVGWTKFNPNQFGGNFYPSLIVVENIEVCWR
jgi:hypothetical protein